MNFIKKLTLTLLLLHITSTFTQPVVVIEANTFLKTIGFAYCVGLVAHKTSWKVPAALCLSFVAYHQGGNAARAAKETIKSGALCLSAVGGIYLLMKYS